MLAAGAAILVADVAGDVAWVRDASSWSPRLVAEALAAAVRNLLLAGGLVGLAARKDWGLPLLGLAAAASLSRRAFWLSAAWPGLDGAAVLTVADVAFRLLCLALVVDYLRRR